MEFAAQSAASFDRDDVGQGASNAGPLPHTPIPAARQARGANKNRRKSHYPWTKDGGQVTNKFTLLTAFSSERDQWMRSKCINIHDYQSPVYELTNEYDGRSVKK